MSSSPQNNSCVYRDLLGPYALAVLERPEAELVEAHLAACVQCWQEYQALSPATDALAAWRAQVLTPPVSMWDRLVERIATVPKPSTAPSPTLPGSASQRWPEPDWEEVASGIHCKLLSTDVPMDRVSMLVRLSRGTSYPPHRHAGVEELYLLEGESWIDDTKLLPGDYHRAEPWDHGSSRLECDRLHVPPRHLAVRRAARIETSVLLISRFERRHFSGLVFAAVCCETSYALLGKRVSQHIDPRGSTRVCMIDASVAVTIR